MKLVKMSLAAAVLLGASAFALENVKVDGDAKLYYMTNNMEVTPTGATTPSSGLFKQGSSSADTALRIGVTGDLTKGVSFGVTGYAISTLGLENNLVSNTFSGAHTFTGPLPLNNHPDVKDAAWLGEAWVASTLGKTTAKLGRMSLDTPLAFSETWSVVPNTFEAAVLINQDIPDTTLVGAWVGKGNGANAVGAVPGAAAYDNTSGLGIDGIMGANGFTTFLKNGAYAAAAVNNSFKPLVAQAWYYNVVDLADAYWLQADWDCQLVKGAKLGVQYADISPKGATVALVPTIKDSQAYAVKLGYEGIQNLKVSAAYSFVDRDGTFKVANVATNNLNGAQSKLYTEAFWNYGYVGAAGASSTNLTAEYDAGVAKLGAYYTHVGNKTMTHSIDGVNQHALSEVALSATKSFGPLDATLAYFSTAAKDQNIKTGGTEGSRYDSILAMLKVNF